jgi:hypothetical protein
MMIGFLMADKSLLNTFITNKDKLLQLFLKRGNLIMIPKLLLSKIIKSVFQLLSRRNLTIRDALLTELRSKPFWTKILCEMVLNNQCIISLHTLFSLSLLSGFSSTLAVGAIN